VAGGAVAAGGGARRGLGAGVAASWAAAFATITLSEIAPINARAKPRIMESPLSPTGLHGDRDKDQHVDSQLEFASYPQDCGVIPPFLPQGYPQGRRARPARSARKAGRHMRNPRFHREPPMSAARPLPM